MKNDLVIDRIRKARHSISAECGHDPRKLVEYYIRRQNKRRSPTSSASSSETVRSDNE